MSRQEVSPGLICRSNYSKFYLGNLLSPLRVLQGSGCLIGDIRTILSTFSNCMIYGTCLFLFIEIGLSGPLSVLRRILLSKYVFRRPDNKFQSSKRQSKICNTKVPILDSVDELAE
jgi:hypothetical protein